MSTKILTFFGLIGYGALALAQVPPGYDAASFARIGVGARALALGGAYVAVAEDVTAAYWNPAGLAFVETFQVEGMYTNWLGVGVHLQYLGLAGYPPLGEARPTLRLAERPLVWAFNWLSTLVPDIPWSEDGVMGTFDARSHLFILSAALQLDEKTGVGVNVKVYHDRILEGWSLGMGIDVGFLRYTTLGGVPISLALNTTDLGGPSIRWYGTTGEAPAYLPWLVRIGLSARLFENKLVWCGNVEWGLNQPRFEQARLGAEFVAGPVTLRLGWRQPLWREPGSGKLPGSVWSLGLGLKPWPWFALDYAYLPGRLGDSHLLALRMMF
ncbi:MAG: PorV/PorQ family protein [Candidatus Bipolaricaulaceae bacterium]